MACVGYLTTLPAFYFFNYLKHRKWEKQGYRPADDQTLPGWGILICEAVIKIVLLMVADKIMTKKLPMMLFGTLDLEPYTELVKRAC